MTAATIDLGGGVHATLAAPGAAHERPAREVDLSVAPVARLLAARAWQDGAARIDLVCVDADASSWVPGLEEPFLSAATAVARNAAAMAGAEQGALERSGLSYGAPWTARDATGAARMWGRHALGFADGRVLLCTAACAAADVSQCESVVASLTLRGALAAEPEPAWWARALLAAADRPALAGTLGAAVIVGATALLLWRRPRPCS